MQQELKMKSVFKNKLAWFKKEYLAYPFGLLLLFISVFNGFCMLEYSVNSSWEHFSNMNPEYLYLNVATVAVFYAFLYILCDRVWLTCFLGTLFCGILAVINHYVIIFHGMPLSFLMIKNFATALNVISSYSFEMDNIVTTVVKMLVLGVMTAGVFGIAFKKGKKPFKYRVIVDTMLLIVCVAVMYAGYFSETPIKPKKTLGWIWTESYSQYGYVACTVESIEQFYNAVNKPDGYSERAVDQIEINVPVKETQTPDIILILNETMYDLKMISEIETNIPYFSNIENMENSYLGYAVVPFNSGGTNASEYELLTSNSLQLIPGSAPFNTLDLARANSVVSVLNAFGYQTLGSHSEPAVNYSRARGYPALGFDQCYFDAEFQEKEYYYRRWYESDKSIYNNLIRWYEEMPEESPRFLYTLTIQNHGQWNLNPPEHDIVKATNDYGEYTEDINEFLTCMYLTDQYFAELTEYFSNQDRPVLICMVGDHCPTIAEQIVDSAYSEEEKNLRLRMVPMIIWANYPLENVDLGTMSMNYVVPSLLEIADVPLTPYYQYMLEVKEHAPILTSMGRYVDRSGNQVPYNFEDFSTEGSYIRNYFYLEYYNITSGKNHRLFQPVTK